MTVVSSRDPTEVFGEALPPERESEPRRFYSIAMTDQRPGLGVSLAPASVRRRLLNDEFPESQRRSSTVLFVAGAGVYLVSIGIAFINPVYLCLGFHGALALYYAPIRSPEASRHDRSG